ncbi:MAG TPA: histidine phosphatase family protein [Thermopolyspora sp.]|jgi:Phosphohistidine phosphatase SixA
MLIVLRHAKAVHVAGMADFERPLTEQGELDARRAGAVLGRLGPAPDLVLCSPAVRARRTAELALTEFAPAAPIRHERGIYLAEPEELLDLVRLVDADVRTLLLVGHNPGVHELIRALTGDTDDRRFPPGAFAAIEAENGWADLWPGGGRAVAGWCPDT